MAIGKTNIGGSCSGGTLTVTAPAGVTVSASKDGRTKTRVANADGVAVFRGLKTGTWTVTITDGSQTATKPVVITADYSTIMAFFAATINITYPSGSVCSATDGTTTLTAPDTSGTWTCVVPNTGTWTITASDGDKTKSDVVTISTNGQSESITLQYTTYLFNKGDTCDALTGGWSVGSTSAGSASITEQQIIIVANAERTFSIGSKNKIDVSEYETLSVTVDAIDNGDLSIYLYATSISNPAAKVITQTTGTVSLDISSVAGANTIMLSYYSEKGGIVRVSEVSLT